MAFRARVLTAIFLVNLGVLGTFSALLFMEYRRNLGVVDEQIQIMARAIQLDVIQSFSATQARRKVRDPDTSDFEAQSAYIQRRFLRLLSYDRLERLCKDLMIGDQTWRVGVRDAEGFSYLWVNPLGAWNRDQEDFGRDGIKGAIIDAMELRRPVEDGGGVAYPVSKGSEVMGGVWFLFNAGPHALFPLWVFLLFGLGGLLFALGAYLYLARAMSDAERKARRAERDLVLSSRLAALGTLAAGISHEINNPLGGMMNSVNRLRKRDVDGGNAAYLELLDEGLSRIANIARRTLNFAPRSHEPVIFPLRKALDSARALADHRLEQAIVRFEVEDESRALVRGDPHELTQVFLNLILNSLDAFDEAGTKEPCIHVHFSDRSRARGPVDIHVRIQDNGPGAPAEVLEHVFDPFYSTKGATSDSEKLSSGLGMSISYTIIEQHGGRITVSAPSGSGFLVEIQLPGVAGAE